MSASFPWSGEGAGVGGYFSLHPEQMYVGGGCWHPDSRRLAAWRTAVSENGGAVHAAIEDPGFVATFGEVDGERLKRVPPGFAAVEPDAELLKLKDVTFGRRLSDDEVFSPNLPTVIADTLAAGLPVMRLLASLPT